MSTDPIIRPRPVPGARLRLFVLHHAGGSHVPYRAWAGLLPPDWELCLMEAPGRATRPGRPHTSAAELAETFLDDLRPHLDSPYALFGHSMGAITSYELTLALRDRGLPLPRWLGLSAINPPEHHPRPEQRFGLPDPELLEAVVALGGTPRETLEHPELWRMIEPVLRADLRLAECWRPRADAAPLPVPLSVFAGAEDPYAFPHLMHTWAARTTLFRGVRTLSGGHFYFQPDPAPLVAAIVAALQEETARSHV